MKENGIGGTQSTSFKMANICSCFINQDSDSSHAHTTCHEIVNVHWKNHNFFLDPWKYVYEVGA
jgi:hypothetical protein